MSDIMASKNWNKIDKNIIEIIKYTIIVRDLNIHFRIISIKTKHYEGKM